MSLTALLRRAGQADQRWWDLFSVVGCAGVSALWYWYTSHTTSAGRSADLVTCSMLAALPLALIALRGRLDRLLRPLAPTLSQVPPLVRLGVGLLLPFIVSHHVFESYGYPSGHEIEFMRRSTVLGTIAAYVWLRQPEKST